MKKIISFILCVFVILSLSTTVSFAKTGDILGYAKYTDISAYINHYPITSYNINDYTAVVAEDLRNYGFDVVWNDAERSLSITKNETATQITPAGTVYKYSSKAGQDSFAYLETDIVTYVNGAKVESFNVDGKTCIYIDALAPCGEVVWIPETRAIKFWIEGLPMKDYAPIEEIPMVTMYSLDGRTIDVLNFEVESYKQVGWYASQEEANKAKYLATPESAEVIRILKKCESYVELADAAGQVLQSQVELYRFNKSKYSYLLVDMVKTADQIEGYLSEIIELCGSNRRLFTLKTDANIKRPIITSSSTSSASTYGLNASRLKISYDLMCKEYGLK